jgi:uncharacterized membrane protein
MGEGHDLEKRESTLPTSLGRAAVGLGLFGIGLGLVELLAPRRGRRVRRSRIAGAIGAVLGATIVEAYVASRSPRRGRARLAGPVRRAITVASTPDGAYRFWRDLANLPKFMERLESLEVLPSGRSRWRLRAPRGLALAWEADIVEDRAGEVIRWQSVEGSEVGNQGAVHFRAAPAGQGTEIAVELEYVPPAGALGRLASFLSDAALEVQLERDLRRLKQLLEVGEIVRSDARVRRERQEGERR